MQNAIDVCGLLHHYGNRADMDEKSTTSAEKLTVDQKKRVINVYHPLVKRHPVTGRKALYVNEHFTRRIVQMNATESEMLLGFLTRWVQNPRFTVRYRWAENTVAMWDNRCTQHFVLNDFEGERVIQRVTVMGDKPQGPQPRWQPWVRDGRMSATSRHDRQLHQFLKGSSQVS